MNENNEIVAQQEQTNSLTRQLPTATPAVDIFENEAEILLRVDMPGILRQDIAINIDNGKLHLSGTRVLNITGAPNWKEIHDLEFRRIFSIPQSIDLGKVRAALHEGVLDLHLPKSAAAKPRQIEIKVG
jgi:HSP20 family protein